MKTKTNWFYAIIGLIVGIIGLLLYLFRKPLATIGKSFTSQGNDNEKMYPILSPLTIREDSEGSGQYQSNRVSSNHTSRQHNGVDYVCTESQPVYAPFDGILKREYNAYSNSNVWKGVEIISSDEKRSAKIMYLKVNQSLIGKEVLRGQVIGYAQAISKRYNPRMKDHIHFELRVNGSLVNPEDYF